ncbi:MAG: Wzz/FepE/Etk N-terminal domain-containing protein [Pseudomonadota bacterium]
MAFEDTYDGGARSGPSGGGLNLDLRYWFWVFRRRFWLFAVVAGLMGGAGIGIAMILPPTYEARAVMLVESQRIPTDLVRSTVNSTALERLEVIKQNLRSRDVLLELDRNFGLTPADADLSPTERVEALRNAIYFQQRVLGDRRSNSVTTSFTIAVRGEDPRRLAIVANDLVTRVQNQAIELRGRSAGATAEYFRREVDDLGAELVRQEDRIVAFKEANERSLPDSLDYRRSQLDLITERLQRFEFERVELAQQIQALALALEGEDPLAPGVILTDLEREVETLRRELARRSAILSPQHPEIRSLNARIAALERVAESEAAEAPATPAPTTAIDPATRELRRQQALAEARADYLDELVVQLEAQRDALELSFLETPNIEIELGALERTYAAIERRYEQARARLAEAEAGQLLEDRGAGERLQVIENATVPEAPIAPNRRLYAAAGVAGGFGGGLGLIMLLEMLSSVVRRPEDLARIGREPAAVIPYIATEGERRWTWSLRLAGLVLLVGGAAASLWAIHTYYLPLETVFEKVLDRSGLSGAIEMILRRLGG